MKVSQILKTLTPEEATLSKNVIAGSSNFVEDNMTLYNPDVGFYTEKNVKYVPSLFKVIDEALVNCSDHFVSCINRTTMQHKMNLCVSQRFVENINVMIDHHGTICIKNDGYGIPIIKDDADMYVPIKCFVVQNTGTNTDLISIE